MNIDGETLLDQYRRIRRSYPFIADIEASHRLPAFLLFAVASRETNCRNVVGDGGHGHGMFQLDDRSHVIPREFDGNVRQQAITAANMLRGLLSHYGGVKRLAIPAYNCGQGNVDAGVRDCGNPDAYTAGHDYGHDVIERMMYLRSHVDAPKPVAFHMYTVKRGDTLFGIGEHYGVSWQEIFALNRETIRDADVIVPGLRIRIPNK